MFALYDGAQTRFRITLHEMAARVDEGPDLSAVDGFDLLPAWDRLALDMASFGAMLNMIDAPGARPDRHMKPLPRSAPDMVRR